MKSAAGMPREVLESLSGILNPVLNVVLVLTLIESRCSGTKDGSPFIRGALEFMIVG